MDLTRSIGLGAATPLYPDKKLLQYVNLKLASLGCPTVASDTDSEFEELATALLLHHRETDRLLADYLCPADQRIQSFLDDYLRGFPTPVKLPGQTFVLDRHGLARVLSLPPDRDVFVSNIVSSYRVRQGVLHNPKSDRRTTKGIFHVAEGGLPIPDDKRAAPKETFARMLQFALSPPRELMRLPFTSSQEEQAECFVSLLLRPLVCPEVRGFTSRKSMEIRFFAPGNLASNLDFVESIFGNAGDPFLPENDAGLDVEHWTGHTGCVILAPHLVTITKKAAGLPHYDDATERQRRDEMCWKKSGELYNDGGAFKLTCRDERGVMVTIIADNYFGYCKKEVKTQISYSANLFGQCEEEHAGGALVFASYDLGEEFSGDLHVQRSGHSFDEAQKMFASAMDLKPEGYGIDKKFPDIIYVPEDVHFDLHKQTVSWVDGKHSIRLLPGKTYVRPSGYKVHMEKPPGGRIWRLVGTVAEGIVCHKPCTVSGGGKSEISKSIDDVIIYGPLHVNSLDHDLDEVEKLLARDYRDRFRPEHRPDYTARTNGASRPILSSERSLGSVIKLFTPSPAEFTEAYNAWLKTLPTRILTLLLLVKRFHRQEWGADWRSHFTVDIVNGAPGHQVKIDRRPLVASYLRVGIDDDGTWRTYKLRQDFIAADKVQLEDDISASTVVPKAELAFPSARILGSSVKLVTNCESYLFQRPDDAIHRGHDEQAEADLAGVNGPVFISNFQPLNGVAAQALVDDAIGFDRWTAPMKNLIAGAASKPGFVVSSAHPRLVDGKPSKNPRYLQPRPDRIDAKGTWLAEVGMRLLRRVPANQTAVVAVDAVLPGRRNNPPEPGVRALACHNPIHYLELPELFMEFASSLTGKSPSTTGAGSEGALTKGPFNALDPVIDLDNTLLSMVLTGHDGFTTSAGCIGPKIKVGHDISLVIPEIWCRLPVQHRDARWLIREGHLEALADFEHQGRRVLASRLGYRITARFVHTFFGKIFDNPAAVFDEAMLKPETQDLAAFVDGIDNIVEAQARCGQQYLDDGAARVASPAMVAILDVMATGTHQGLQPSDPAFRARFGRDAILGSTWYRQRLEAQQARDAAHARRQIRELSQFLALPNHLEVATRLDLSGRLRRAEARLEGVTHPGYLDRLRGTLGLHRAIHSHG